MSNLGKIPLCYTRCMLNTCESNVNIIIVFAWHMRENLLKKQIIYLILLQNKIK
jgi:hypothetical protein